ncbi:MAG TPA: biopolymer transporter ExbD [Verrucomicrobiae bacterium]|nr:biopolymer transporter ExbD [Verrucomicrobiae bacterium]
MNFTKSKKHKVPSVIIVSLIDVLLVVLIFLMVSTTFKQEQPALKLTLPESKVAKPGTADQTQPFVVSVSTNFPYFYIGEKPVNYDQLQRELEAAVQKNPQLALKIRADKQAPVGEFLRVIDAGKLAKIQTIDAITEKARQ